MDNNDDTTGSVQNPAAFGANGFLKTKNRVRYFKDLFAQESPPVRMMLVQDLEAYNVLLELRATSFEELALLGIAKERGLEYDPRNPPLPACPFCGSINVRIKEIRNANEPEKRESIYRCNDCKKTFTANYNSITSGSKMDLLTWTKLLICMLRYETVAKTCDYCNINPKTYYRMRSRIYYAFQIFLDSLRLYGNIQVDETYIHISYKGSNLCKSPFPEDDNRFEQQYKPRERRDRGGAYSNKERNINSICIFATADDFGHVFTCYSGVGIPGIKALRKNVPIEKFLSSVPEKDPFLFMYKPPAESAAKPGSNSLFICDGAKTLVKFATEELSLKCHSQVFRRNGKQIKLPKKKKHLNIQRVNYVHKRLEDHLVKCGAGSSRYIKGSLLLFDFIMNTGGLSNQKAFDEILRILVTPMLGKDEEFYDSMFAFPNHLFEWFDQKNALNKLPYNKVYAYFLYDKKKHPELYPGEIIHSIREIESFTELSATTIINAYWGYREAGYHDRIIAHFYNPSANVTIKNGEAISKTGAPESNERRIVNTYAVSDISFVLLDEFQRVLNSFLSDGLVVPAKTEIYKIMQEKFPQYTEKAIDKHLYLARSYRRKMEPESLSVNCPLSKGEFTNYAVECIFDEYAAYRKEHVFVPASEEEYLKGLLAKYSLDLSISRLRNRLNDLIHNGKRPPLPGYKEKRLVYGHPITARSFELMDAYERVIQDYVDKGLPIPTNKIIIAEVQKEFDLQYSTIYQHISLVRQYRREQGGEKTASKPSSGREVKQRAYEAIYDEYANYRITHVLNTEEETLFLDALIKKFNLLTTVPSLRTQLYKLVQKGIRPPLPKRKEVK